MNSDFFYLLLLCLVSGFTQAVLLGLSLFMFRHHRTFQYQRVFAAVLILHSIGFFNNFLVAACQNLPCSDYINTLLIFYDYMIVGGYMIFTVALVFPNRYRAWQLLLLEIPFVAALILFAVTGWATIYPVVQIFTMITAFVLLVVLEIAIRRYTVMLHDNVLNIEHFDLRWGAWLIAILFVVQLFWAVESLSQKTWFTVSVANRNLLFDTLWCFIVMAAILFVMRRIIRQEVFVEETEETEKSDIPENATDDDTVNPFPHSPYLEDLMDKNIEDFIHEKKIFLDKTLTLQKLSAQLGTNRQYLSNYINQKKGKTFYDYINDFRLEEAKRLLDTKGTQQHHSIEEIAVLSGFNSYSTFLRSFAKKYGQTPSQYMRGKQR